MSKNKSMKNNKTESNEKKETIDIKDYNKLKKDLEISKQEIEKSRENYKRAIADFENYKKNIHKRMDDLVFEKQKALILDFLDFKNTLNDSINKETDEHTVSVLKRFNDLLENTLNRQNIKKIEILNKDFDYNLAECISKIKSNKDNKVIDVLENGYTYNKKLIKPAKVVVGYKEE